MEQKPNPLSRYDYVFIITYGRSGSTLLQRLLQSIPGYCIRGENDNLLVPLFRAQKTAIAAQKQHGIENTILPEAPWHGIRDINTDGFTTDLLSAFVTNILKPDEDARTLGFKEIRYIHLEPPELEDFLLFLHRQFNGAKLVFNTRDTDSVLKSGWWKETDHSVARPRLQKYDAFFNSFTAEHPDFAT